MSWLKKFLPVAEEAPRGFGAGFGFQVLKNTSPLLEIEPWFDYICGINGRPIEDGNAMLFKQEIGNCAGRDVTLRVWSAKGQRTRDIIIPLPPDATGLGLSLQWISLATSEDVWHILDVAPNSPADHAGLLPYGDYIIGTPEGAVRGESALGELVEDFIERPLRLYVYNHEYDVVRELAITPRRNWGGEGALGCVLGFGALHRVPPPLTEPPNAPGETLFDSSGPGSALGSVTYSPMDQQNFITPATMYPATTQTPPPPQQHFRTQSPAPPAGQYLPQPQKVGSIRHKTRHHAHHMNPSAMDAFMREEEQKSRELDYSSSGRNSPAAGPPPPPKAGPPPRRTGTPLAYGTELS
ncbi:hypothetical protein L873DRAFT_1679391 [Choiromyces venosus 120613-1]|uniref:PDZ GRASP-type domain-containing protein n=1 Tax=Choiromyces venosus 120613-1 TaxID=1336337 RepID=A0A3N4JUB4_9PEZI|nr:hypothetical protein L873DRAFT_1679391 [Choiromyces venosus 120613-1]